jgi:very-short-patch-repair endonuclease
MKFKNSTERKYQKENNRKETPQEVIVREILTRHSIPFIGQKIVHHPRGFYLLDFMIRKPYRIALEVDGWQHLTSRVNYDVRRTLFLEREEGLKVLRFRNDEVNSSVEFERHLLASLDANKLENRPLTEKELTFYRRFEYRLSRVP